MGMWEFWKPIVQTVVGTVILAALALGWVAVKRGYGSLKKGILDDPTKAVKFRYSLREALFALSILFSGLLVAESRHIASFVGWVILWYLLILRVSQLFIGWLKTRYL